MKTTLRLACLLALTYVFSVFTAHAQTLRLFVASYGNDGNSGSRTSPKRTFQAAYDAMSSGGDIYGLDTAGYATGTLNITKSISITMAPGCEGIVTASGGNGITISGNGITLNNGLRVSLRGLRIEATAANSGAGIYINAGSSVEVDHCTITGFGTTNGQYTGGIVTNGTIGSVVVTDTVIKNCPGNGITHGGFGLSTSSLVVEHCRLLSNGQGLYSINSDRVTVRNCTVSHNTHTGIGGGDYGSDEVTVNVENCAVTDNGTGISRLYSAGITVSNTAITGNTTGVAGSPFTFGNNQLINNTTDGSFGPLVGLK